MRKEITAVFGDPIPTAMLPLATTIEKLLIAAENSQRAVKPAIDNRDAMKSQRDGEREGRLNAEYLHPRNVGGHYYPTAGEATSDCEYCKSWTGPFRSGSPEGVDQFGDCPGNPKLRDAYELLKSASDNPGKETSK